MQFTTTLALLVAGATASPLLGLTVGGLSVNVASSSALLDVNLAAAKSSSAAAAAKATTATVTAAPTAIVAAQPVMPSSFSAPVQGSGVLTLENLPAMPAVIDKALSGVLGSVLGLCKSLPSLTHISLSCKLLTYSFSVWSLQHRLQVHHHRRRIHSVSACRWRQVHDEQQCISMVR
jgi:hypothetical protein